MGPVASPCRTLQYAHDNTSDGGEIDVLDAAGYGTIQISKTISIINDGVGTAGVLTTPGQDGIKINTVPTAAVVLRGLTVDGGGVGQNGIVFYAGGSLTISNCVVQNFAGNSNGAGNGILLWPNSGSQIVTITNTTVSDNQYIGLSYLPGGSAGGTLTVDRVTATRNGIVGIAVYTLGSSGISIGSMSNSLASNSITGIQVIGGNFVLDNVLAFQNSGKGILATGDGNHSTTLTLGRSSAGNNGANISTHGDDLTTDNNTTLLSYGDNHIKFFTVGGAKAAVPLF